MLPPLGTSTPTGQEGDGVFDVLDQGRLHLHAPFLTRVLNECLAVTATSLLPSLEVAGVLMGRNDLGLTFSSQTLFPQCRALVTSFMRRPAPRHPIFAGDDHVYAVFVFLGGPNRAIVCVQSFSQLACSVTSLRRATRMPSHA